MVQGKAQAIHASAMLTFHPPLSTLAILLVWPMPSKATAQLTEVYLHLVQTTDHGVKCRVDASCQVRPEG